MFQKIAKTYLRIVETICVALLFLIICCMVIQIGCRLLNIGQNFTEEAARMSFSLIIFVGAPLVLAEGGDIVVDMLVNALPKGTQRAVNVLVNILIMVFSGMCIKSLVPYIQANEGITAVSITWIKMNWIYTAVLISFGFLFLVAAVKMVCQFKGAADTIDINKEAKELRSKEESEVDLGI